MSLNGKIAIVTGASRGIGKAIAQQLAQQGATVVATATSEEGAQRISEELPNGKGYCLDISSAQSIESFVAQVNDDFEPASILINNAGITNDDLMLRMGDEEWQQVINTNLTGVFRLTKACLRPMFRKRWGRIVNISSIVGFTGNAGQANYCAAKSAVIGFGKSLALEVASRGITVNAVAPGFIDTDMTKSLPDMVKDEMKSRIPMKQMGEADDIAAAVSFLVSDGAKYITGETIHVNGGMFMA